jgi:hypothetical protein
VPDPKPRNAFTEFLTRLIRVPKREIDEQEQDYQKSRETDKPAKPREIVPRPPH